MRILLVAAAILCLHAEARCAGLPLPEQNLTMPVLISFPDGGGGSGFYLTASNRVFLATARHVIFEAPNKLRAPKARLVSHRYGSTNESVNEIQIDLAALAQKGEIRAHTNHDVVLVRLGKTAPKGYQMSKEVVTVIKHSDESFLVFSPDSLRLFKDVKAGDDVFVFGYPSSIGLRESPKFDYEKPLLRKGIVSGVYAANRTIVLDSSVYFGNSGGPVIEVENPDMVTTVFPIIGIVSEMIPFVDVWENKRFGYANANFSNSGYSVVEPVDFILELLWD